MNLTRDQTSQEDLLRTLKSLFSLNLKPLQNSAPHPVTKTALYHKRADEEKLLKRLLATRGLTKLKLNTLKEL